MHAPKPIGPLFEVIVYVRDMAAQVEFYRDVLGLPLIWPPDAADFAAEHWVSFDAGGVVLALHSGGTASSGTPPRFGFRVDDIDAARARFLSHGVDCDEVRSPAPGVQVADCRDPEGHGFFIESQVV